MSSHLPLQTVHLHPTSSRGAGRNALAWGRLEKRLKEAGFRDARLSWTVEPFNGPALLTLRHPASSGRKLTRALRRQIQHLIRRSDFMFPAGLPFRLGWSVARGGGGPDVAPWPKTQRPGGRAAEKKRSARGKAHTKQRKAERKLKAVANPKPVPKTLRRTPRSSAESIYIEPSRQGWPIGDLYHARLALVYAMSPQHADKRVKVLRAVQRHYPGYAWARWWDREVSDLPQVCRWDHYMPQSRMRAAANPRCWGSCPIGSSRALPNARGKHKRRKAARDRRAVEAQRLKSPDPLKVQTSTVDLAWNFLEPREEAGELVGSTRLIFWEVTRYGRTISNIKEQEHRWWPRGTPARKLNLIRSALQQVLGELRSNEVEALMPADLARYVQQLLKLKTAHTVDDYAKALRAKSRLGRLLEKSAARNPRPGPWVEKIYRNGTLYSTVHWHNLRDFWREVNQAADEQDEGNEQLRENWKQGPGWAESAYTDGAGNRWRLRFRRS